MDERALTNEGSECVKTGNADNKKRAAYFQAALLLVANGLWNGRKNDWLEQPSETKWTTKVRPLDCLYLINYYQSDLGLSLIVNKSVKCGLSVSVKLYPKYDTLIVPSFFINDFSIVNSEIVCIEIPPEYSPVGST